MVASLPKSNATVGGNSSVTRNDAMGKQQRTSFTDVIETDDNDDTGGGVLLRDFEDDDNHPSHEGSTSTGTRSSTSSTNNRAAQPHQNASTTSFVTSVPLGGHNVFAPIGTGRFSEHTVTAKNGDVLDASIDHSGGNVTIDSVQRHSDSALGGHNSVTSEIHNSTCLEEYLQSSPRRGIQPSRSQGFIDPFNMTPNTQGGTMQYPLSAHAMGYPWSSTPTYRTTGNMYKTPQTTGYAAAKDAVYPKMDATPSHMPKKVGQNSNATPQPNAVCGQYNQTEPRNFAPRVGTHHYMPPPPAFGLGHRGGTKRHEESLMLGADTDPFLSPPASRRIGGHSMTQTLFLPSVPENNQLAMVNQPWYDSSPAEIGSIRSDQLNKLTAGPIGLPTQEVALDPDNFPFIEAATQARPVGHGVVKIKNIPFGTKRAEIIAFLGRNSKILNDNQEPVHIIMERVSSKTQDCYVEFVSTQDAVRAVDRHRENMQNGRPSRLGDRPVEVQLSSQAALMKDLFPLAAGVWWDNAKPVIQEPIDGQPWKTFKGFVTEEEMTMLVKHVEIPQRSPYSKECPQRPYECMISTIKKLPWYMADHITLRQRHAIYDATVRLIVLLKQALQREHRSHETVINPQLMKRLVTAAMLCPGFSVVQKDNIAVLADMEDERARMFNQPQFADHWVHLHALCPKPGTPLDVLEWYIAIIREETTRLVQRKHIVERSEIQHIACYTSLYFGYMWHEIGLPTGRELDNLTLRQVARCELAVIEQILRRVFPAQEEHALN